MQIYCQCFLLFVTNNVIQFAVPFNRKKNVVFSAMAGRIFSSEKRPAYVLSGHGKHICWASGNLVMSI